MNSTNSHIPFQSFIKLPCQDEDFYKAAITLFFRNILFIYSSITGWFFFLEADVLSLFTAHLVCFPRRFMQNLAKHS